MSRNPNNLAVRWRNHAMFCILIFPVLLYPALSRGSDIDAGTLYLIADSDNTSSTEHILFGFDGGRNNFTERMRLTDTGRLGINRAAPLAVIEAHTPGTWGDIVLESPKDGSIWYDQTETLVRLGIPKRVRFWDEDTWENERHLFHGMEIIGAGYFYKNDHNWGTREGRNTLIGFDVVGSSVWALPNDGNEGGGDGYDHPLGIDRHRALTLGFNPFGPQHVYIGAGHQSDYFPTEALDVNGAIRIGLTTSNNAGTIRYKDGKFEGYNGTTWLNLGAAGNGIRLQNNEKIVFGVLSNAANNYLVNSLHAPPDPHSVHFPIPPGSDSVGNYNSDDVGTSGGIAVVTGGNPHFTVKGNGNTYVHKRLSVGIGGYVDDAVMTVAGAVHIGPDTMVPSNFNYGSRLDDYLLWVEKGIVSEDFAIAGTRDWSDHVFEEDYDLKPLADVESFIEEEGHLPGVPSARDVAADGYSVHDMTRILLEKVEELTLHAIAQQKAIDAQRDEIAGLRAQLQLAGGDRAGSAASYVKTGF